MNTLLEKTDIKKILFDASQTIRRYSRKLFKYGAIAGLVLIAAVTITVYMCGDPDYKGNLIDPTQNGQSGMTDQELRLQTQQALSNIPNYKKGEEQTYLTLPEWYLVFNPNEYAEFLADNNKNPSDFPFIKSIDEYWTLYDRVTKLTQNVYPENSEYKTMLWVIGVSTTAEYLLKGLYENTMGRISYWTASEPTPEDRLIRSAQAAYAKLIYTEAWYKFPFFDWVKKMWSDTPFFGKNFMRKIERKLFFTLEFGVKTVYAKLIGFGAQTAYDPSDGMVTMLVKITSDNALEVDSRVLIKKQLDSNHFIISIPRWGGFTEIMPKLTKAGVDFIEISGNDDIVVTVIAVANSTKVFEDAQILFSSRVFYPPNFKRLVYSVKVAKLAAFMTNIEAEHMTLEHIYDY